jgi:outer membrane protein assembly factor BamA
MDEEEIRKAKLRLSTVPNFKSVDIHLEKGTQKGRVVVVIEVVEADPFAMAYALGSSYRLNSAIETAAARFSNNNLFGDGKVLDLLVVGDQSITSTAAKDYHARLEYFDPQLFGSRRYFLTLGVFHGSATYNIPDGTAYSASGTGVDLTVGRRLGDFWYATVGVRHFFNSELNSHYLAYEENGGSITSTTVTTLNTSPNNLLLLTFGRHSEDDPSFPTRGWMFHISDISDRAQRLNFITLQTRVTWSGSNDSVWTLQQRPFKDFGSPFDADLGVSLSYARPIFRGDHPSGIRRGRWYVGPGFSVFGHSTVEVGVKAGVRLETKYFGVVNLYAIGSGLVHTGSTN